MKKGSGITGDILKLPAPAKINLSLRILGRRPDGYHDLDTVMQKVNLCDLVTLSLVDEPGFFLHCPDSDLPVNDQNIVVRAARAFFAATPGKRAGVQIKLEKRIPVAAGLGGGSSDAGTVLLGLNRLFETNFSTAELIELARPLGADVPFFVTNYNAVRAEGIGDRMTPVPSLHGCSILLVNPGFTVSTRWVYEKYALTIAAKDSKLPNFSEKIDNDFRSAGVNDLEQVTFSCYPEMQILKDDFIALGASSVLMSGSGPTLFGIFPDEDGKISTCARQAADLLQQRKKIKVFVTQPL